MNPNQLSFTKTSKVTYASKLGPVLVSECEIENLDFVPSIGVIGIDPGKNFGLVYIGPNGTRVMNGKFDDSVHPLREGAFHFIQSVCRLVHPSLAILEGASYGDRFGQVKLAEVRCGFALGVSELGIPVEIVAPKSPRKVVFGSGDTVAMDVWVSLNHNASDALCLALYPYMKGAQ